jgi:hypothetical protein
MSEGDEGRRMVEVPSAGGLVERRGLQRSALHGLADIGPERIERPPGLFAAAAAHAVGEDRGVHGTGRGAGDRLDLEALVLEQAVEHAPGISAVGAAALQGEVDAFDLHDVLLSARSSRHPWAAPRQSLRR